MNNSQIILKIKMINKVIALTSREIHLQETNLTGPDNHQSQDNSTEVEMILGTMTDEGLEMTIDNITVKIEEILILKLSLKSTLLESLGILDKRTSKKHLASLERSKTSQ